MDTCHHQQDQFLTKECTCNKEGVEEPVECPRALLDLEVWLKWYLVEVKVDLEGPWAPMLST
jgi:hypothetical protein